MERPISYFTGENVMSEERKSNEGGQSNNQNTGEKFADAVVRGAGFAVGGAIIGTLLLGPAGTVLGAKLGALAGGASGGGDCGGA
jgi:hypothetical protein